MVITLLSKGYPDRIGKRFAFVGYGNGPASYVNSGTFSTSGDPVNAPNYTTPSTVGFGQYIDLISGNYITTDGTYIVRFTSTGVGNRQTWVAHWYPISTAGTETANGVNLSTKQVQFGGFGGVY